MVISSVVQDRDDSTACTATSYELPQEISKRHGIELGRKLCDQLPVAQIDGSE